MAGNSGMLGVVELVDAVGLKEVHGEASVDYMRDAFIDRMKGWLRPRDNWQQLDGNRVCVMLRGVSSRGELELATAKLARLFETPHYHYGRPVALEISAGFTSLEDEESGMESALQEAGAALREAKRSAHFFDVYTPECGLAIDEERELVSRLESAVELGELQLYFQPKVHAGYHSLVGAEALLRWHTADRRVVGPNEFISVAENNDVIRPMTWWVIKAAVARLARWPEELSIAVNVAPNLLLDDQILAVVNDALDIHGVDPGRLTLEVTERVMVDNHQVMLRQLARLWRKGVKISLDDFGTGFSSLAYFRDLPVDEIKIDKSFVLRMLKSERDMAIVKAVIDLAHNFSLRVVAEGVEDLDIAIKLAEMGCDVLQGYVFDKPLPVETFESEYGISSNKTPTGYNNTTRRHMLI